MIRTSDRMQEELRNFGKGLRLRFDAYATDTTQNEMLGTRDEQGIFILLKPSCSFLFLFECLHANISIHLPDNNIIV